MPAQRRLSYWRDLPPTSAPKAGLAVSSILRTSCCHAVSNCASSADASARVDRGRATTATAAIRHASIAAFAAACWAGVA